MPKNKVEMIFYIFALLLIIYDCFVDKVIWVYA